MVVFKKKWLFWASWLYSGNVVVFGQKCSIFGKSGCIGDVWLYAVKVVVYGQK